MNKLLAQQQAAFHNRWINTLKNSTKASYVSHMRQGSEYYLKVIMGEETLTYKIEGSPSDMTDTNYRELLKELQIYGEES